MTFTLYDASVPVFVSALSNMRTWLDKAASHEATEDLTNARLTGDMRPLAASIRWPPNFYFHVTIAYAILRAEGVPLGKPFSLQHLGAPDAV